MGNREQNGNCETKESKVNHSPGIKLEPPYSDADMVAADIIYLKHRCSGKEFLQLIAHYTHVIHESFEEIIQEGRCALFLEHADMEFATYEYGECGTQECLICCEWAQHHLPRAKIRKEANERLNSGSSGSSGEVCECSQRSDEWRLAKTIATTFPTQMKYAAQICIRKNIDPTMLGDVRKVLGQLSDGDILQNEAWEELHALYREKGLGLWPSVSREFAIRSAETEHIRMVLPDNSSAA